MNNLWGTSRRMIRVGLSIGTWQRSLGVWIGRGIRVEERENVYYTFFPLLCLK